MKFVMRILAAVLLSVSVLLPISAQDTGEVFAFKFKKDDMYRILSKVEEDVFVNNVQNHHSEIVSRISVHITDVDNDGNASHEASFMTSDESEGAVTGKHFTWNEEYQSKYVRSPRGEITIDDTYFMPVVRNVPVFPDKPVKKGDVWTAAGCEAHDLRRTFNLQTPYLVPFNAVYTYNGIKEGGGKRFNVFTASYSLYYETPKPASESADQPYSDYPVSTMGYSNQTIYWDSQKGAIDHYDEDFRITITTSYGNIFKFTGTTHAEVTEFKRTATEQNVKKLQDAVGKLNLNNVSVKADDKGLTLSIDNIQFEADSAILLDSEKIKLNKLAGILKSYPDNDLLVSGHTALAGREDTRQKLSEDRAQAVADYLVKLGVKDAYHIFTRGFGANKPVASNDTEEGKAKNRRVEITIMDK